MRTGINQQERTFAQRRARLTKSIKGEVALFSSAPQAHLSRDQHHTYRANTDLLYLTGIDEPEIFLVLLGSSSGARSVLFCRERDAVQELWQGERIGLKRAKRLFQIDEVRDIENFEKDLKALLKPFEVLHYALGSNPRSDKFVIDSLRTHVAPRVGAPSVLKDSRLLTSAMRFVKDKEEILSLRHAGNITAQALTRIAPVLSHAKSELHAAKQIETIFAELGSQYTGFHTIVASGKNATELHHLPTLQPLWKEEPVLIDCGASYRGYSGDITRVFPVRGNFSSAVKEIYQVVYGALEVGKKHVRAGSSLAAVHKSSLSHLVSGLVSLKILKGTESSIIESERYKPYFPHRIGHWLGLDVHDCSPLYEKKPGLVDSAWEKPLVPGNALTVEPGLYFHILDERVPKRFRGIGIRLEDSMLITSSGNEVLSKGISARLDEVEELVNG
jgi:Xaa-Pro aminopeptidase